MHAMKQVLILAAVLGATPAAAINKCVVDGRPVFQNVPCAEQRQTAAQDRERQKRIDAYHQELDQLAAQGHGLQREAPKPPPAVTRPEADDGKFVPKSRAQIRAERDAAMEKHREASERGNAESAARLTRMIDGMAEKCGGDPQQAPQVGMSDARFRECTLHARFGGVRQVVAVERDRVALRLYIFGNAPRRVYSVDGVVTAIRP
jgi:hypothetical protein